MRRTHLLAALALVAAPPPCLANDAGWAGRTMDRAREAAAAVTSRQPAPDPETPGDLVARAKDAAGRTKPR